ncbi:ArgE/DapE family deacylase [Candidatus Aerophobetes bacterium]|nr:ArgE/DapE family deacylase [Candidatus Aerophobetes bacterium]
MKNTYFKGMVDEKEAANLLGDLISINSVNPLQDTSARGEKEIALYIRDYLKNIGVKSILQPVLDERPNVIGILDGKTRGKNFVLEAHMDTVKVDNMMIEPFSPRIEEGKIFGRGACDDKGSLASMLLALKLLKKENVPLKGDVYLAAVVDEENKYRGVSHLLNQKFKFDAGIVGEPTNLDILIAHRGCLRWRITTKGVSVHSSEPERGKNAIYFMNDVIFAIREKLIPLCREKSHPLVGSPSLSVNIIQGGTQVNIVPDTCFIEIDRRMIPGEKDEDILQEVDALLDELRKDDVSLKVEREAPFLTSPPMQIKEDEKIVQALFGSAKDIAETQPKIRGGRFDSDAGKFVARRIPTPVFGPGDIAQAHSGNEWVKIKEVVQAAEIIARTIVTYQVESFLEQKF